MKTKILSVLLVVSMLLSFFVMTVGASGDIVTPATGYTKASDVQYKTYGDYLTNWGARGEDCTFLSKYAESFYTGSNTYASLSQKKGGTSQSNAPSSALYSALKSLMKSAHKHETNYGETRYIYRNTDCLKNDASHISSFYSGATLNGSWGSTPQWNREHTWPNSKGLGGADENDIMMLRPTANSENTSRGNTAYGESSKYFDPGEAVRGDCARIVLYVYTRWGNTGKMWGEGGVMENMSVLLKWMKEDPVDTWEMGRNDVVQDITGTRNVFVDYPEFAWLLFGQDIPSGMPTPSGEAGGVVACTHPATREERVEPTCTTNGKVTTVCTSCGRELSTTTLKATGHNYVNDICSNCGHNRASGEIYYAIYNDAAGKLMTTDISTYTSSSTGISKDQFVSASATLTSDGKLKTDAKNVALFKMETVDDTTSFITPDGKYLSCDGEDMAFVDAPTENTEFVLEEVSGGYYIRLKNFLYEGSKAQYLEFYRDMFTNYGMGSDTSIYTFTFRELSESEIVPTTPAPEDPTTPSEPTEATQPSEEPTENTQPSEEPTESTQPSEEPTEPEEGYVAIYNAASGKVMTTEQSEYNGKKQYSGADASLNAEGKLVTEATNVAFFKVETVNGVTTFTTADGKYLYMDDKSLDLVDAAGEYTNFILEDAEGGKYVKSQKAVYVNGDTGEEKAQYLEYYAGPNVFTVYSLYADKADIYTFNFVELAGEESEEPTGPSEEPTGPSEEPTGPSEEPTGPSEQPTEPSEPSEEPGEPSEPDEEEELVEYKGFNDVKEHDWFYDNVVFAVEHGLMKGVANKEFDPNGNVTRAMLVTILYRNENEPDVDDLDNPFDDVKKRQWYTDAVIWAADNEIVKGMTEDTFEPDTMITREQIATILYRYAEFKEVDVEEFEDTSLKEFADRRTISSYAKDAIEWAVGAEIINGIESGDDTNVAPAEPATRAQIAAMLNRYIEQFD